MGDPKIALVGSNVLVRGSLNEIAIEIVPDAPFKVAAVDVRLTGTDGWLFFVGQTSDTQQVHVRDTRRLLEDTTLPAGPTRLVLPYSIPRTMAPTHQNSPAWSVLVLLVKLVVPQFWKYNVVRTFPLQLALPRSTKRQARAPSTVRTSTTPGAAFIELSLGATHVVGGETLLGSCAVFHVDDTKARTIRLALVPHLKLFGGYNGARREGPPMWLEITMPAGGAGKALGFKFIVPPAITPTFKAATHDLAWVFSARLGTIRAAIPIEIHPPAAAFTTPITMPLIADRRVMKLFDELALAGWTSTGAVAAERTVGRSVLRVSYDYRGELGTYLVGRVSHDSLGLGLSVAPSSRLRDMFRKDVEVGIAEWDRNHHVTARFDAQAVAMLEVAVPRLQQLRGTIVNWTDTELEFEESIAGLDIDGVTVMASSLEQACASIEAARAAISLPPGLTIDLGSWQELAGRLDSVLSVGDLSTSGRIGHVPVTFALVFDDDEPPAVIGVRATAGDPEAASAATRAVTIRAALPNQFSGEGAVATALAQWPAEFVELEISDGVGAATFRSSAPHAERARELVHALLALLVALDPGAGPYR